MVTQSIERAIVGAALGIVCLALSLGSFFLGKRVGASGVAPSDPAPADTVWVRDTVTTTAGEKTAIPKGYELVLAGTAERLKSYESLVALYRDSLNRKPVLVGVNDTTHIAVPMSDFKFTDHETYEFAVNGYNVSFLWHKSFPKTAYIPQVEYRPYRWTLYPTAGVFSGAGITGAKAGIGADISISANGRWRFSPEAGYALIYANNQLSRGFYGGGSIKYNIIQSK
ncbi:MAG: hypothetical protein J6P46_06450 [Bacteroidales bacterium]|nr:hypothetical protein [Bacteroidales bacterium]